FDSHGIRRHLLGKGRRSTAVFGTILIPMPWTGDASVDDPPFSQRPALMGANIPDRGESSTMPKHGDSFVTLKCDHLGLIFWNLINGTCLDPFAFDLLVVFAHFP